jgi:DNA primase
MDFLVNQEKPETLKKIIHGDHKVTFYQKETEKLFSMLVVTAVH